MRALLVFNKHNSFHRDIENLEFDKFLASFDPLCSNANYVSSVRIVDSLTGANFISQIIEENKFDIIIFSDELVVRETASYFAGKYNLGLITHSKRLLFENNNLIGIIPGWESIQANVVSLSKPKLVILKSDESVHINQDKSAESIIPVQTDKIKLRSEQPISENPLKTANVIIGVGRGAKKEVLPMIFNFAQLLGAEVGCTRPVADMGLLPSDKVIGDSGVCISPHIYIAIGISGALQHIESVNADFMISINSDPGAPIFGRSNISINQKVEDIIGKLLLLMQNSLKKKN